MLIMLLACGREIGTGIAGNGSDTGATPGSGLDYEDGNFLYTTDHILDFGIALDEAAIAALAADSSEDVVATFTYEDESYEVGLHLKGSPSGSFRTLDGKAALKVDFHQWDREQEFHGVRRLTLNNMIQDSTMSHEHAAYRLFAEEGVVAPRHGYARVTVNGEWFGLYGIVETADEQFVNRHWPGDDEGHLYEGGYGSDLYEWAVEAFEMKEGDEADRADLAALVEEVESCGEGEILPLLERNFDVDALLAAWAVELAIADPDGYTTLANNYLLYYAPVAAQWTMIPWGPDQGFEGAAPIFTEMTGRLVEMCVADADCTEALRVATLAAVDTWESSGLGDFVNGETARIEADCRADPRSEWGDIGCRDAQAALREWVSARPAAIRAEVE
ncbi:MAG: CotH kinase family protein [Deltaproteobacteria bacterium]|nr:CotH kinase family protein [Deltaproteobacteria bacterium]